MNKINEKNPFRDDIFPNSLVSHMFLLRNIFIRLIYMCFTQGNYKNS